MQKTSYNNKPHFSVCLFVCLSFMCSACEQARDKRFFAYCCTCRERSGNHIFGTWTQVLGLGSRVKSRKKVQNSTFFKIVFFDFFQCLYENRGPRTQKKWFLPKVSYLLVSKKQGSFLTLFRVDNLTFFSKMCSYQFVENFLLIQNMCRMSFEC